ncbi:MAG: 50S ribosomal protein L1 [Methanomicrobiales archaeon]|jgi:large subunit ribosomal protein L1|nr:50S ribosomal protein L1 [Burkholderiaceae bacterium]NLH26343.1 50S ribosomal protein L1 [Methanomicrobiales archaeon]HNB02688.1 50S ribosomal protein L1 [Methanoregulaceae archaeon]HNW81024.1 50S ribosomal protein L1 [Methanoregulaceae archaeon]HPA07053.1 50S ribosomal protein L1 [Methanoregulaceae archaeon]
MVERARILEAVKAAIEKAPERKFSESVDITINLKNIDMAQPKNRIDETILLPHGTGKTVGIAVLGKGDITTQAREAGVDLIIGPEEIERLGGEPREARQVAGKYRFFLADTGVMPQVGRFLGPRLGPRGRMPTPIPGGTDIRPMVERLRKSVKVRTKDKKTFHVKVGSTQMPPEQIAENIDAVLKKIEGVLEQGSMNIRSVFVKTTMGPAERLL